MKITLLRVENYKSFSDSEDVPFSSGFAIITGRNNAGKTSFIDALSPGEWGAKPHRSTKIEPGLESNVSSAKIKITTTGPELRELYIRKNQTCAVPSPPYQQYPDSIWIDHFFNAKIVEITVERQGALWSISDCKVNDQETGTNEIRLSVTPQKVLHEQGIQGGWGIFAQAARFILEEDVYVAKAARLSIGKNKIEGTSALHPTSSNLSDVLHTLYTARRSRFDKLTKDMISIFPNIENVDMEISYEVSSIPETLQTTQFAFVTTRIRIAGAPEDRDDLAFDLADCGSGVGQVLSMLYIIHSSAHPKTIVIDEPNSFLHPGAARKLMEVFRKFPQNQYIIITHSTETINSIPKASLHLVLWRDGESIVEDTKRR